MKLKKITKREGSLLVANKYAGLIHYEEKPVAANIEREYIVVDFGSDESTFLFRNKGEFWEENEGKVKFLAITELVNSMDQFKVVI